MSITEIIDNAPLIRQEEVKNIEECQAISVQVAGTNGKGSTCAFLSSILRYHGKKVGVYTSPHVNHICERIAIDGKNISESEFEKLVANIDSRQQGMCKSDLMFFAAVHYFNKNKVDYAVFETGLGGSRDSATLIYNEYGIITQIGFDHTEFLGDTLEKITVEKAGIIKKGMSIYAYPNSTNSILEKTCYENKAKYNELRKNMFIFYEDSFSFKGYGLDLHAIRLSMKGDFQGYNCICAMLCARDILGNCFDLDLAINAVESTMVYGRMTVLKKSPFILADVSHNPDGVNELCRYISGLNGKKCAVVSIQKTKDYKSMMERLKKDFDIIISTKAEDTSRNPEELGGDVVTYTIEQAYFEAVKRNMDIIVFCGSFATVRKASTLIF